MDGLQRAPSGEPASEPGQHLAHASGDRAGRNPDGIAPLAEVGVASQTSARPSESTETALSDVDEDLPAPAAGPADTQQARSKPPSVRAGAADHIGSRTREGAGSNGAGFVDLVGEAPAAARGSQPDAGAAVTASPLRAAGPADQPAASGAVSPPQAAAPADAHASLAAAQLGHALARVQTGPDGSTQLVVQLNPNELGQLRVHIVRTHDGAASVSVAVERPETLHNLQADLGRLHQALDRAGLPDHRTLSLHLAGPDTPQAGAGTGQGGNPGGFQQSPGARQDRTRPAIPTDQPGQPSPSQEPHAAGWLRAGVNITA